MFRLVLVALILLGSFAGRALGHPEPGSPAAIWDETVNDTQTAWLRLKQHRDALARSLSAGDVALSSRLATELPLVAGDLVRVSSDLPENALSTVHSACVDLERAAFQLRDAAESKNKAAEKAQLNKVDFLIEVIGSQYTPNALEKRAVP